MTDTPIYDWLKYEYDNPNWREQIYNDYYERVLKSGPSMRMEKIILSTQGKDEDFIYEYQVNELKTRRRRDPGYHRDFKLKHGRKVYRSVVDWSL